MPSRRQERLSHNEKNVQILIRKEAVAAGCGIALARLFLVLGVGQWTRRTGPSSLVLRGRRSVVPGRTRQHARKVQGPLRFAKKSGRERSIFAVTVPGGRYEVGSWRKGRRSRCVKSGGEDAGVVR